MIIKNLMSQQNSKGKVNTQHPKRQTRWQYQAAHLNRTEVKGENIKCFQANSE
jgi:hypothetical protein